MTTETANRRDADRDAIGIDYIPLPGVGAIGIAAVTRVVPAPVPRFEKQERRQA